MGRRVRPAVQRVGPVMRARGPVPSPDGSGRHVGSLDQRRAALLRVPGGTERPARASVAAGVRPGDVPLGLSPRDVLPGAAGARRGRPRRSFRRRQRVRLHRGPDAVPPRRGAPERPRRQFLRRRRREHHASRGPSAPPRGGVRRVDLRSLEVRRRRIGDGVGSIRRDGRDRPRRLGRREAREFTQLRWRRGRDGDGRVGNFLERSERRHGSRRRGAGRERGARRGVSPRRDADHRGTLGRDLLDRRERHGAVPPGTPRRGGDARDGVPRRRRNARRAGRGVHRARGGRGGILQPRRVCARHRRRRRHRRRKRHHERHGGELRDGVRGPRLRRVGVFEHHRVPVGCDQWLCRRVLVRGRLQPVRLPIRRASSARQRRHQRRESAPLLSDRRRDLRRLERFQSVRRPRAHE